MITLPPPTKTHPEFEEQFLTAVHNGDTKAIRKLVRAGMDINTRNDVTVEKLAEKGHIQTLKWMVNNGLNIQRQASFCYFIAVYSGKMETAEFLQKYVTAPVGLVPIS